MQCWRQGRPQAASPQLLEARQYPGNTPAVPRSFGKLQGRVWGPRGDSSPIVKPILCAIVINSWPSSANRNHLRLLSNQFWAAKSHLTIGEKMRSGARFFAYKWARFWRQNEAPPRRIPYYFLRFRRCPNVPGFARLCPRMRGQADPDPSLFLPRRTSG